MKCFANPEKPKPFAAGTVAPSHLLLKFGKLTAKFEMLCKETESPQFQNFGGETREFFARCVDGRGDMIRRQTARRCAARARSAVGTAA